MEHKLKIYITPTAWLKLKYYVLEAKSEISGLGISKKDGDSIIVKDILLFHQECSSAHTDLDKKDIAKFLTEAHEKGMDTKDLNVWWHSHADMGVFWSFTDNENIDGFIHSEYMISIVANKELQTLARVDIYDPLRVIIDQVPLDILWTNNNLQAKIKKEVLEKVKEDPIITPDPPILPRLWPRKDDDGFLDHLGGGYLIS